jgi:hypothetical protein
MFIVALQDYEESLDEARYDVAEAVEWPPHGAKLDGHRVTAAV